VYLLCSVVGITHKDDFRLSPKTMFTFRWGAAFFSMRPAAAFLKYFIFRAAFIRLGYALFEPRLVKDNHSKIRDVQDQEEWRRRVNFEIQLWQANDVRTYMEMATAMFKLNLTGQHVDLGVYHIAVDNDRYFDNVRVEQHMRSIYKDFHLFKAKTPTHSVSIIATAEDAAPYIPPPMRRLLSRKPEA
jgi:hypothetical protein